MTVFAQERIYDERHGLSVVIPEGWARASEKQIDMLWKKTQRSNPGLRETWDSQEGAMLFRLTKRGVFNREVPPSLTIATQALSPQFTSALDVTNEFLRDLERAPRYELLSGPEALTINGNEWIRSTVFRKQDDGTMRKMESYYLVKERTIYSIVADADAPRYVLYEREFDEIIHSILLR